MGEGDTISSCDDNNEPNCIFWIHTIFLHEGDEFSSTILVEHLTQATSTTRKGSSSRTEFFVSETVLNEDKTMSIATIRPSPEKSAEGPRKFIHRHIDSVARIIVEESVDAARIYKQPVEDKQPAEEGKELYFNKAILCTFILLTSRRTHFMSCDLVMQTCQLCNAGSPLLTHKISVFTFHNNQYRSLL